MNANFENPNKNFETYLKNTPTKDGRYGEYGGAYLPPDLIPAFEEIICGLRRMLSASSSALSAVIVRAFTSLTVPQMSIASSTFPSTLVTGE